MTRALHLSSGLTIALALFVGCSATPDSDPIDPFAVVPANWEAREVMRDAGGPTADPASSDDPWWTHFDDPDLAPLILEALAAHPDLRAAAARVAAASAALDAAGSLSWPELTGSLSAGRQRQNFIGIDIPGTSEVLSSTTTSFGASLSARWEVDLWGRLSAVERAAAGAAVATAAEAAALRLSLSGQVAIAWFSLIEAQRQHTLAIDIRDRLQSAEDRIAARTRQGLRSALDLRLARSERASADADGVTAKRRLGASRRALELLLGRYPAEELAARETLPPLHRAIPVGIPAATLARRPDLIAARARLESADADRDRAEADLWPQLVLTAGGGRLSEEFSDLLDGDFSVWSLATGLVGPIFDHGRRRAEVDAAAARRLEAEARFAGAVLDACAEVEGALRDETLLAEQQARLAELLIESRRARDLAIDQYSAGLADILAYLEAERSAARAEARTLEVERARLENRVRLWIALGGSLPASDLTAADPTVSDPTGSDPTISDPTISDPTDMREESAP